MAKVRTRSYLTAEDLRELPSSLIRKVVTSKNKHKVKTGRRIKMGKFIYKGSMKPSDKRYKTGLQVITGRNINPSSKKKSEKNGKSEKNF